MNKLVSVVIPTYGKPVRLKDAINSVLAQDYSPLELIIVDDNGEGTERQIETKKLVEDFIRGDLVIKYVCHKINKNGSAARNTGIRVANGEYIALLDDDDIFLPMKISRQVEKLELLSGEYKACYTSFCIIFPNWRRKNVIAKPHADISLGILNNTIEIPSSTLMFSKAAWECIGGFDESFKRHQDWEFIIRLAQISSFINIDEICTKRIITRRNAPKNFVTYQEYREHFLKKMKFIITTYSKEIQQEILFRQNMDITFQYFKNKHIVSGVIRLIHCGKPFVGLVYIYKRIYNYFKFMYKR